MIGHRALTVRLLLGPPVIYSSSLWLLLSCDLELSTFPVANEELNYQLFLSVVVNNLCIFNKATVTCIYEDTVQTVM